MLLGANKQWQDAGLPPVRIAVNLSAIQFLQPTLAQTIRTVLKETGLFPEHLELEITENIAIHAEGIVMAIIGMGRSLKLKVIAEGVETQMQADFLKLNGCDEVQGYFYGKPMEGGDLALLMAETVSLNKNFYEAMV